MDGIERRCEARGGGEGRKLSDCLGGLAFLVGQVGDGERDASGSPVGNPGLVEGGHPHLVALPHVHPAKRSAPVCAQERREVVER